MMTQSFGVERLIVYQKGMQFAEYRHQLLDGLPRRVAACDHIHRGAESILVNIAHAHSAESAQARLVYLGHANGSALECAACLDVFAAKNLCSTNTVHPGKELLSEVVSILVTMRKITSTRLREGRTRYRTKQGRWFDHEDLGAYQEALHLIAWVDPLMPMFSCSFDLKAKLDKSTTSMVLNIAEGNGRFNGVDRGAFCKIAYKATVQTGTLMDLIANERGVDQRFSEEGHERIRRIMTLLSALARAVDHE